MVDGTGLENQRTKVPQVRILSLPPDLSKKYSPVGLYFVISYLAAVFETGVLALVAMLVIVVAVLLRNYFHFEFSCHGIIISQIGNLCYNRGKGYVNMVGRRRCH